jgi:lipid-A-disaccharide synthase
VAASGTVTVEAAILGLPLVVVYRLHWFTYWLAQRLVKIPFFTMVNLVADKVVFEEFLQEQVRPENISRALADISFGGSRREQVLQDMSAAVAELKGPDQACRRAAAAVLRLLRQKAADAS